MADYLIPFGIDGSQYFSGLIKMSEATDNFVDAAKNANNELKKGFDETARANAELRNSILQNVEAAKAYRNELKNGVTPDLQKFQQVAGALQINLETLRMKLSQTTDPKQIESFNRQISFLDGQMKSLKGTFDTVKPLPFQPSIGIVQNLENNLAALRQKVISATSTTEITNFNKTIVALEGQLRTYRTMGVNPAMEATAGLSRSGGQAGATLTDMGRILQDLPFGMIGIQNNIGPLVESFGRLRKETGSVGGGGPFFIFVNDGRRRFRAGVFRGYFRSNICKRWTPGVAGAR